MREGKHFDRQVSLRHKHGHRVPVDLHAFPIRDEHGAVTAAAETFEETISVAAWDRRQDKRGAYGCLDAASGVLTHEMIQAHLREALGVFAEKPVPFSVLCIEIDHLDQIQTRDGPGALASVLREGLRIELTESATGTFFDSGSPKISGNGADLLTALAQDLGKLPNKLALEGHTDSKPYSAGSTYGNWELSADRANAARRLMMQHGIRED